uniref:Cyochrome c1 ABC transporter channel subunit n=1 Tax=Cyanidium caldarium TaxID=2771 RepID=A0A7H0WBB3_CYACA|nr:cyochrome c1 ABC transporter channel subunit [Cyanidium caldarium]QNR39842.1 cyochrome c1 ABC transporter channel subunit [Cyanidium caldarium]
MKLKILKIEITFDIIDAFLNLRNLNLFFIFIIITFEIGGNSFSKSTIIVNSWIFITLNTIFIFENFINKKQANYLIYIHKLKNIPLTYFIFIKILSHWIKFVFPIVILNITYLTYSMNLSITKTYLLILAFLLTSYNLSNINAMLDCLILKASKKNILILLLVFPNYLPLLTIIIKFTQNFTTNNNTEFEISILCYLTLFLTVLIPILCNKILKSLD